MKDKPLDFECEFSLCFASSRLNIFETSPPTPLIDQSELAVISKEARQALVGKYMMLLVTTLYLHTPGVWVD